MADVLTKEQRRRNMQSIRSVSKLESEVSRELWKRGFRFRRNVKSLKGKPDIAIKKYKVAVFIDSCFWHYCDVHGRIPSTNSDYWEEKFKRNKERDAKISKHYKEHGWHILRIWEHEIKEDFIPAVDKIADYINNSTFAVQIR